VLAIVIALLSGTGGRDSSQPGFPFPNGSDSTQLLPGLPLLDRHAPGIGGGTTLTAAYLPNDRTRSANQQSPGDSPSGSGQPDRSGSQPKGDGGKAPGDTPGPNRPQAPSETSPDPPRTPSESQPSLPQTPSTPDSPSPIELESQPSPSGSPIPSETQVSVSEPQLSVRVSTEPVQASVTVGDNTVQLP
jgi:hypothetical protein